LKNNINNDFNDNNLYDINDINNMIIMITILIDIWTFFGLGTTSDPSNWHNK